MVNEYSLRKTISEKINSSLVPFHFEVINESHMHSSSINAESHFKLIVVSSLFDKKYVTTPQNDIRFISLRTF